MNGIKKIGKELLIFGIVAVCFVALYAYKQIGTVSIPELSKSSFISKMENKEDMVVYVGTADCSACQTYKPVVLNYIKNHSEKIYYIDLDTIGTTEDVVSFMEEYFDSDTSTPQTFSVIDGEVKDNKTGVLDYYALTKFVEAHIEGSK